MATAAVLLAGCGGGGGSTLSDEELNRIRSDPRVVRLEGILERATTLVVSGMHGSYTLSRQEMTASVDWVEQFYCSGTRCVGDQDSRITVADFSDPFTGVDLTFVDLGSRGGFDTLIAGGRIDTSEAVSDVDPHIIITSIPSARSYGYWGQ